MDMNHALYNSVRHFLKNNKDVYSLYQKYQNETVLKERQGILLKLMENIIEIYYAKFGNALRQEENENILKILWDERGSL